MSRFLRVIALSLLGCCLVAATPVRVCADTRPTASSGPLPIRDVYVIHFVLDGTNLQAFNEALADGKLPTLKRALVDNGAVFEQATSLFPSTSTNLYQAFITGLMPGHAGIPQLERFDREHEEVINYLTAGGYKMLSSDLINLRALTDETVAELNTPTSIFDLLHGYPTAAVYSAFSHGESERFPGKIPVSALWSTYVSERIENVDVIALKNVLQLFNRPQKQIPRYSVVGLYSSDIMGHKHGPFSRDVREILIQFDLFLREFLQLLEMRGLREKTYIIVSSDHGMHDCGNHFKLDTELKARGIALKTENPRDHDYTLVASNRGVSSAHLYARRNGTFEPLTHATKLRDFPLRDGTTTDLIELIRTLPATDLVIVRDGDRKARIFTQTGATAEVACFEIAHEDYCSYTLGEGRSDPLGYRANPKTAPLADGLPHSTFAWREAAAETRYPDAVVGFSQIFHDGRAGDLFLVMQPKYGLRKVKLGNHGGAVADDMRIPLLMAGPTVPHGRFGNARAVDLYPLVLSWFGIERSATLHDGRDPFAPPYREDPLHVRLAALDQLFATQPAPIHRIDNDTFVRTRVDPLIPKGQRKVLIQMAHEEAHKRGILARRLQEQLRTLEAQKQDRNAPRITSPQYLDDNIAIVKRVLAWSLSGSRRMDDIASLLAGRY